MRNDVLVSLLAEFWAGIPWVGLVVLALCAAVGHYVIRPLLRRYVPSWRTNVAAPFILLFLAALLAASIALIFAARGAAEQSAMIASCSFLLAAIAAVRGNGPR